jgi:murein DD-endopeptidase MepM/ murein hydrolase activator NlpD
MAVEAKTVGDLRNELQRLYDENKATQGKIQHTQQEISNAQTNIKNLNQEIDNIAKEMEATIKKIEELNTNINNKNKEIKELMSFIQISDSSNIYMEYISGAQSLTDFIYRVSVSQQLLDYNNELIKEMNQMIVDSNNKKVELKQDEENSRNKISELNRNIAILGSQKQDLYEYSFSIEEEIKNAQTTLQMYIDAGCNDNDDINVCANKFLPPDTSFWRPIEQGYITSEYGWRIHPITGTRKFHDGIDMSNSDKNNTKVYAAASGRVAAVGYNSSTGNYIYIHHNINNKNYTTTYLHLKSGSITVKVGNVVNKNTVIAIMGTTGDSTGPHLHFAIATGLRGKDYVSYSDFVNHTVNPRNYVNFTSGFYRYWYDRVRKVS